MHRRRARAFFEICPQNMGHFVLVPSTLASILSASSVLLVLLIFCYAAWLRSDHWLKLKRTVACTATKQQKADLSKTKFSNVELEDAHAIETVATSTNIDVMATQRQWAAWLQGPGARKHPWTVESFLAAFATFKKHDNSRNLFDKFISTVIKTIFGGWEDQNTAAVWDDTIDSLFKLIEAIKTVAVFLLSSFPFPLFGLLPLPTTRHSSTHPQVNAPRFRQC
jgi:hypothetical protein